MSDRSNHERLADEGLLIASPSSGVSRLREGPSRAQTAAGDNRPPSRSLLARSLPGGFLRRRALPKCVRQAGRRTPGRSPAGGRWCAPTRPQWCGLGQLIEAGTFAPDTAPPQHTHEGSLGNLCLPEIRQKLEGVMADFAFKNWEDAMTKLMEQ